MALFCRQLRCERFVEELENYAKQVEEFLTFGLLSELGKYLKKAQALNSKLEAAMEKVSRVKPKATGSGG